MLCTAVAKTKTATRRFVELDEGVTNNLLTNGESQSRDVIDDLTHRIWANANLGPFVILLIDPSNRNRRQDRSAKVTRHNLELILNGHLDAVPLFFRPRPTM